MKIKMRTLMCGPGVLRHPGEVCVIGPEEAEILVDGGYADLVDDTAAPEEATDAGGAKKRKAK